MNSPLGVFSEDIKIVPCAIYASGTSDVNTEVIDTAGFGRCIFVWQIATVAANAVTQIFMASSDAATNETTLSSGSNVAGSAQAIADDDDNQVFYQDFIPTKRYYQSTIDKDTSNAVGASCVAYLYHAVTRPVTHAAGTSTVGDGSAAVNGEELGAAIQGTI